MVLQFMRRKDFLLDGTFGKICGFLNMFSTGFTSFSALLLLPISNHCLSLCAWFLMVFHLKKMRFSQSTNLLKYLAAFNVHHKDWLTYSGGTDGAVKSLIIFISQTTPFPNRIHLCDSHSPAFLDTFASSKPSIYSTVAFSPLGNFDDDDDVVSVSLIARGFVKLPNFLKLLTSVCHFPET